MMAFLLMCALSEPAVPVTTVARGTLSSIDQARQVVVRTEAEWEALWQHHGSGQPTPKIDFRARMVLGVFAGSRSTAGYAVEIVGVRRDGADLVVEYREVKPGRDQMVAQIITAPFHLVSVDRQDGAVRFVERRP
jgi:hypothetical protein